MLDINKLITEAVKSGNRNESKAYRNLKAEIQKVQTAKNAKPYTEEIELQVINKYVKSLEDAIFDFSRAGRDDLVAEYTVERDILKKFLPEPVTRQELQMEVVGWCQTKGYTNEGNSEYIPKKEMGACIKWIKSKFPTADGKEISQIVREYVV